MSNPNPSPATRLKPGDPRINRKGRPPTFDAWRALLQDIANEPAVQTKRDGEGKRLVLIKIPKLFDGKPVFEQDGITPVMIDHYATNAEMVARQIMSDPKRQVMFIEGAYGKVPQAVTVGNPDGSKFTWAQFIQQGKDDTDTGASDK